MQKLVELEQRMKTLHNIRSVARTLATVSAAKLASTRRRAAGLRAYSRELREVLFAQQAYLERQGVDLGKVAPLLREPASVERVAVLVIAADRGMCGAYNLSVCRAAADFWQARQRAGQQVSFLARGNKGARWLEKRGAELVHRSAWRRGGLAGDELEALLALLLEGFLAGRFQEVHAAYTRFYSPLRRVPRVLRLLPLARPHEESEPVGERLEEAWWYEPSFAEVFEELVQHQLRIQLEDVLLESYASEHGARMITMEEASERAEKAVAECHTRYHRLRREAITTDLIDVLFASRVAKLAEGGP